MACAVSVLRSPVSGEALPFFYRYNCAGPAGTDVLAQDVSIVPGTTVPTLGSRFPPPVMAGHIVRHLAECKAHGVVLLPDAKAYWFPVVQLAEVKSITVAPVAATGCFQCPSPKGGLRNWWYNRWGMVAYKVDFRSRLYCLPGLGTHRPMTCILEVGADEVSSPGYMITFDPLSTHGASAGSASLFSEAAEYAPRLFRPLSLAPLSHRTIPGEGGARVPHPPAGWQRPVSYTHLTLPTTPYV